MYIFRIGSGMGMPSIGIYAHELITQFGVKNLIRIGSCGSFQADVHVRDIIIGQATSTNSNWQSQYDLPGMFAPVADWGLLRASVEQADALGVRYHVGNILSSDIFYNAQPDAWKKWAEMGVLAVEMEAAALYMTATKLGAKALCILTVSDSLVTWEETSAEEREKTFTDMMKIALEIA